MDALGGVFYVSRCGQRTYVARAGARRSNSFTDKDLQLFSKHPQGGVDILPIYSIMGDVEGVAQLVRVPDCRSGGCGFESRRPRFVSGSLACLWAMWIVSEKRQSGLDRGRESAIMSKLTLEKGKLR